MTTAAQYKPWGHLKRWPQWLRMVLLGEGPVFHLLKEVERWRGLTTAQRKEMRKSVPDEIPKRHKTLAYITEMVKTCLVVVGGLLAGVLFAFSQRPKGYAAVMAMISLGLIALSILILLRVMLPPPHTLFTAFVHPMKRTASTRRWTTCRDEKFLAGDYADLLDFDARVQFNKRGLILAAITTALALIALLMFFHAFLFL